MTNLHFNGNLAIEDLRDHPPEIVEKLRNLLRAGVHAHPDPRRHDFYEVENGKVVFYIHVAPASAKVHLLAAWSKDTEATAN